MKATGIVRRIDDLGRVVIPKEIRRTMRIREGDPLEIYTDRDAVIACAGVPKKSVIDQKIGPEADRILEGRQMFCFSTGALKIPMGPEGWYVSSLMPILSEGDIIGAVMCLKNETREVGETEKALMQTAGLFLGRQLEE